MLEFLQFAMTDITPTKWSRIVAVRFRNTETIPKRPLHIAKSMQRRRVVIYGRIWCMLEFSYA